MPETVATQLKALSHIQQHIEDFIGQSHILTQISDWLQQNGQRFFVLAGEPRVGKSAIASHLLQTRKDIIVAYHFCQLGVEETVRPGRVLQSPGG